MRGRWAAGIVPRNFTWIIKDRLAVSERPGGYAPNHRKVRRQEELLWLRAHGIDRIVSLLGSSHNLHAYDEQQLAWSHFPLGPGTEATDTLAQLYPALHEWLRNGDRILVHQEELGDRLMGVVAGYLCWSGILPDGPRSIAVVEQILKRQMGSAGRVLVTFVTEIPAPPSAGHGESPAAGPPGDDRASGSPSPAAGAGPSPAAGAGPSPAAGAGPSPASGSADDL